MADEFEQFLAAALGPAERLPDRKFVARVQAQIALDELLAGERRLLLSTLAKQVVALIAIAAGLAWLARSASVADFLAAQSGAGLLALLTTFGFVTVLLASGGRPASALTMLNGS